MLSAIDYKLETSPIQWIWRHVKGHQYDHIGTLYIWDTLNLESDLAAKKIWSTDQKTHPGQNLRHKLEDEIWLLYTNTPTDSKLRVSHS